ncbi:MAG: hypothetical protein IH965_13455 [Gemmatimonadetes bacterium]|nr:hypothetical protein [Gemmatimonadota bacterium]
MANRKRDQRSKTDPRKRASRYTKTVGMAPHVGRRYVTGGKVRIVWAEQSSPTPGPPPRPTDDTSLTDAIRAVAVALLDLADRLADRVARILRWRDPS